jgi:hypothetical protein
MFNFLRDSVSVDFAGGFDANQNTLPHWYVLFGDSYVLVVSE